MSLRSSLFALAWVCCTLARAQQPPSVFSTSSPVHKQRVVSSAAAAQPSSAGSVALLVGGSDSCATPDVISGLGPHAFDNSAATTGSEGQNEAACFSFGSSAFERDVWFCWTAPASGTFEVTTIGLTTVDTRVAVFSGCGCPSTPALACNDDACGTNQSATTFNAVAGSSYTIHIGSFPGAAGGTGQFELRPFTGSSVCQYDDGSSENSIGLTGGGRVCWLQRFGEPASRTLVSDVSVAYGTPLFPGGSPPAGTPVDVLLWDDPTDDGDPSDCVLVFQGAGVVTFAGLGGGFDTYATAASVLDGVFFAGVALAHPGGQFPAGMDTSSCTPTQPSWIFGSNVAPLDYNTLTNNQLPPANASQAFLGVWLLRAGCASSSGTSFCGNDDPLRIPCPCANNGTDPAAGCANSSNPAGARVTTSGFAPTDDVVLHSTGMTGSICIFFRTLGPSQPNGVVFGDGITCTGGSLLRLRAESFTPPITGVATFPPAPPPATITLSARSGTFPGSGAVMQYSSFYRNAAAAFCPPSTFNTANTIEITW